MKQLQPDHYRIALNDGRRPFYDAYCKDGKILFAMGETGTMWKATIEEKLAWIDQMTSAETAKAMPHYVGSELDLCAVPVQYGQLTRASCLCLYSGMVQLR